MFHQKNNAYYIEGPMEIKHFIKDNILIVNLIGENLDTKAAPVLKAQVLDLVETTGINQVIFDLDHLQFVDSTGLSCLLSILRQLNQQEGELKLAQIAKPLRTMFELVSLHKIFETFNTTAEALASYKPGITRNKEDLKNETSRINI